MSFLISSQAATNTSQDDSFIASSIVYRDLTAETPDDIHRHFHEPMHFISWTEALARVILRALANAIMYGAEMARAAREALARTKEAVYGFATEHPVYLMLFAMLLAMGVLANSAPWILNLLGFGKLGRIKGSFAAVWQSLYHGYVPNGALLGSMQRLGMAWSL
ncbi:hypothetical protein BJY01DRAFT_223367 [Aspergillus pseudoustus]|uniref:Uncharacterized protein n=1 Tax=Aspergillus pseudoustus TaxID=1810923 RepID=A0ABR4J7T4_9EURO